MQPNTQNNDFHFGPIHASSPANAAFWNLHDPVVRKWILEMQAAGDPWWQSALHAAYCLVSYRELDLDGSSLLHWDTFDVEYFLFRDLSEGGTVGFYGSVP